MNSNIQIYGIVSDENIEKYCVEKDIPYFKKDPIDKIIDQKRTRKSYLGFRNTRPKKLIDLTKEAFDDLHIDKKKLNVYLLGSGSFHHATYGILKNIEIKEKIDVISIDAHDDFWEFLPENEKKVSYCNHHSFSLRDNKNIDKITAINHRAIYELSRFRYNSDPLREKLSLDNIKKRLSKNSTAYLTIDIDVLDENFGLEDYEKSYVQGNMPAKGFLEILDTLLDNKDLIGIDICGITPHKRSFMIYDCILKKIKNKKTTADSKKNISLWRELHSRPSDYESDALAAVLQRHKFVFCF